MDGQWGPEHMDVCQIIRDLQAQKVRVLEVRLPEELLEKDEDCLKLKEQVQVLCPPLRRSWYQVNHPEYQDNENLLYQLRVYWSRSQLDQSQTHGFYSYRSLNPTPRTRQQSLKGRTSTVQSRALESADPVPTENATKRLLWLQLRSELPEL